MYRLYDYLPSGNGYKCRLVLKRLAIPYELVELDITKGASRTPEFMAKNPNGRIPLLEVAGHGCLAESHAIIEFLARDSELVPREPFRQALMRQWMCFEQYNLEPNIATARFWLHSQHKSPESLGEALTDKHAKGRDALRVLEAGLAGRSFLVGDAPTLADIALYAYTHVAGEALIPLEPYPGIRAWIGRIEAQPRWAPITAR